MSEEVFVLIWRKVLQLFNNHHKVVLFFALTLTFLISSLAAHAAPSIPYKINFQGRLTNTNGNVVPNGLYNVRFKIMNAASGGAQLWSEDRQTASRVQITNGLFDVRLGDVTALSPTIFNSTTQLYLEVELPSPATATCVTAACAIYSEGPLTPRQPIAASPYAFNADMIDGIDGTQLARVDQGNVFTGTQLFTDTLNATTLQRAGNAVCDVSNNCNYATTSQFANTVLQGGNNLSGTSALLIGTVNNGPVSIKTNNTSALTIDSGQNTSFSGSVVIAGGKSLTISGGVTSSRPSSPVKGMMYFDSQTNMLLTYNGSKWQSDRTASTRIVAASNAPQAVKDSADYVTDGVDDNVEISDAISAASTVGGVVYLTEGNFSIGTASISLRSNVTLQGSGGGTLIRFANGAVNRGMFDWVGPISNVRVSDFRIDGNKVNNPGKTAQDGLAFYQATNVSVENITISNFVGKGLWAASVTGMKVTGVAVSSSNSSGLSVSGSSIAVTDNKISSNIGNGLYSVCNDCIFKGNVITQTTGDGVYFSGSKVVFSGNTVSGSTANGVRPEAAASSYTGNTISSNGENGIFTYQGTGGSVVSGNTVTSNVGRGIRLDSGGGYLVSGNNIDSSGQESIYDNTLSGGNNTITGNNIIESNNHDSIAIRAIGARVTNNTIKSDTGSGRAINIISGSSGAYLSGNFFSGSGVSSGIANAGTNTVFSNQSMSGGGQAILVKQVDATAPVSVLQGAASQTADLLQAQNSAGTTIAGIRADGRLFGTNGSAANDYATVGQLTAVGSVLHAQGGNSFGHSAVIGTADAYDVEIKVGGSTTSIFNTAGDLTVSRHIGSTLGDIKTANTTRISNSGALQNVTADAGILTAGTVGDARLSSNVALKNTANTFTQAQTFQNSISATSISATGYVYMSGIVNVGNWTADDIQLHVESSSPNYVTQRIRAASAQAVDIFQVQSSAGADYLKVNQNGTLYVQSAAGASAIIVRDSVGTNAFVVDAAGSILLGKGGTYFSALKRITTTWNPPSTANPGTSTNVYSPPSGAVVVGVVPPAPPACGGGFGCTYSTGGTSLDGRGLQFTASGSSTPNVLFVFANASGAAVDPPTGTWTIWYIQP